ncbi:hypothetical protein MKD33_05865, partial [Chromobacterium piscinae]
ASKAAL